VNTTDPQPGPVRIPIGRSVCYAVRGLPEVPNQYGRGVLAPSEITLTYRAAPDSGLGRVHAYVAGRIWVDGNELPLLPSGLYGQHYDDGLDGWPGWLTEEVRLHDPDVAPVSVPPAADRAALRDRTRALALLEAANFLRDAHHRDGLSVQEIGTALRHTADEADPMVGSLARDGLGLDEIATMLDTPVLPASSDRAAVLTETERTMLVYALDQAQEAIWSQDGFTDEDQAAVDSLRRMAAETPQPETEEREGHPAEHTWKVESPRRDNWASWGATYDDRDWAQERYESAIENAPQRPFRLVRGTTTYTVEAEHTPAAPAQPAKEA
jgi:hypothetical protein